MTAIRRSIGLLLVFVLAVSLVAGDSLSRPHSARAASAVAYKTVTIKGFIPGIPNPCDLLPDGAAQTVCKGVTDPVGTAADAVPGVPNATKIVGDAISGAAETVATATLSVFIRGMAAAAAGGLNFLYEEEYKLINNSTIPNPSDEAFTAPFELVFGISFFLGLALLATTFIRAAMRRDLTIVSHGSFRFITFLLVASILPPVTSKAVQICDGLLTPALMSVTNERLQNAIDQINAKASAGTSLGAAIGEVFILLLLLVFAAVFGVLFLILWAMRYGAIPLVIAGLIVSLSLGAGGAEADGGRSRRLGLALIGLTVFKIVVAFIMLFNAIVLANGIETDNTYTIVYGSAMQIALPLFVLLAWRWITMHDFRPMDLAGNVRGWSTKAYRNFGPSTAASAT